MKTVVVPYYNFNFTFSAGGVYDFIAISVNASTPYPMADCRFLCGFSGVSNYNLHFKYSTENNFTNPLVEKPLGNGTTEAHVIFPLRDPMPPAMDFYHQVLAFDEDQHVLILGNFTTGNYSDGKHSYTQKLKYTICTMSYYISIESL